MAAGQCVAPPSPAGPGGGLVRARAADPMRVWECVSWTRCVLGTGAARRVCVCVAKRRGRGGWPGVVRGGRANICAGGGVAAAAGPVVVTEAARARALGGARWRGLVAVGVEPVGLDRGVEADAVRVVGRVALVADENEPLVVHVGAAARDARVGRVDAARGEPSVNLADGAE
eukprot:5883712-Prymnesium_polylepis.1